MVKCLTIDLRGVTMRVSSEGRASNPKLAHVQYEAIVPINKEIMANNM
jgi:hypothetical protein